MEKCLHSLIHLCSSAIVFDNSPLSTIHYRCSFVSLVTAEPSFAVAWPLSLSSAASSFVVTWPLSLNRWVPLCRLVCLCRALSRILSRSYFLWSSQFTFGSTFIAVSGSSSSKAYLSWVRNTTQHSMYKLSTWVNIISASICQFYPQLNEAKWAWNLLIFIWTESCLKDWFWLSLPLSREYCSHTSLSSMVSTASHSRWWLLIHCTLASLSFNSQSFSLATAHTLYSGSLSATASRFCWWLLICFSLFSIFGS